MKIRILSEVFNKIIFVLIILSIFSAPILSKKIGDLDNILKPFMLKVGKNKIYISDQYFVLSYSIDKLNFQTKIGGRGEGPGQFLAKPSIKVLKNRLLLHSPFRSILFSQNGELLEQLKYDKKNFGINCVRDNYIAKQSEIQPKKVRYYITNLVVMDSNFTEIKVIHSRKRPVLQPMTKQKSFLIEPVFKFQSFEGKIYVAIHRDGMIQFNVFDHNGKLLKKIHKEWGLIKIPDAFKKRKLDEFKSHPVIKKRWAILSRYYDYTFPDYFPAMADFRVRDGKIYVKTYNFGIHGVEFLVLDLQGKLLTSSYLPDTKDQLYDIKNNHIYFLKEDEDLEVWELHSIKIQ